MPSKILEELFPQRVLWTKRVLNGTLDKSFYLNWALQMQMVLGKKKTTTKNTSTSRRTILEPLFLKVWKECKLGCYNPAVITGGPADCEITLAFIYEYLSARLALEQMSSHGRKNNPSISLSPLLCASFFTFIHSLLLQSPFQCLYPLLHFPPTFSL